MKNKYYTYPEITNWGDPTVDAPDFRSGVVSLAKEQKWVAPFYDLEAMMHTATGKEMMIAAELEKKYTDINDPGLKEFWDGFGLEYTVHETKGENWLSFVPKCVYESEEKLPVVLAFRSACVFAQSFYYDLEMIAAQGQMILLVFSTEDRDANELWLDILDEAKTIYPVDETRVYLTGHSHYGDFALEFMRRHHEIIAAVAQQGDIPGCAPHFFSDEDIEKMRAIDMPIIAVSGTAEMSMMFPMNVDARCLDAVPDRMKHAIPVYADDRISAWQRRLYAANCPMKTKEEILAARNGTRAEQNLGFPCDHSETLWVDGQEVYIGDLKDSNGNEHLRVVAIENLTHTTCEFMHTISWSYLRRFARDFEQDKVIELYR